MTNRVFLGVVAACVLALGASGAQADETLKYRQFVHVTAAQSQDVGDVDGHALTVFRFSGLAPLPDGTVATTTIVGISDYIKGSGTNRSYFTLMPKDGSVLFFTLTGTGKVDGATTLIEGKIDVLGGKGRFEGAKGEGTASGVRLAPLAAGADLYLDVAINLRK
jgi:hypothetical protein